MSNSLTLLYRYEHNTTRIINYKLIYILVRVLSKNSCFLSLAKQRSRRGVRGANVSVLNVRVYLNVDVDGAERDEHSCAAQVAEHCGEVKRRLRAHRHRRPSGGSARGRRVERHEQLQRRRAVVLDSAPERRAAAIVERVDSGAGLQRQRKWRWRAFRFVAMVATNVDNEKSIGNREIEKRGISFQYTRSAVYVENRKQHLQKTEGNERLRRDARQVQSRLAALLLEAHVCERQRICRRVGNCFRHEWLMTHTKSCVRSDQHSRVHIIPTNKSLISISVSEYTPPIPIVKYRLQLLYKRYTYMDGQRRREQRMRTEHRGNPLQVARFESFAELLEIRVRVCIRRRTIRVRVGARVRDCTRSSAPHRTGVLVIVLVLC